MQNLPSHLAKLYSESCDQLKYIVPLTAVLVLAYMLTSGIPKFFVAFGLVVAIPSLISYGAMCLEGKLPHSVIPGYVVIIPLIVAVGTALLFLDADADFSRVAEYFSNWNNYLVPLFAIWLGYLAGTNLQALDHVMPYLTGIWITIFFSVLSYGDPLPEIHAYDFISQAAFTEAQIRQTQYASAISFTGILLACLITYFSMHTGRIIASRKRRRWLSEHDSSD